MATGESMFEVVGEAEARLTDDGVVTITSAFPAAQRIQAKDLREGDRLFDCWGGTHYIASIRRQRGHVYTAREDGWEDTFHRLDEVTIIRDKEDYRDA